MVLHHALRTIINPKSHTLLQSFSNLKFIPKSLFLLNSPNLSLTNQINELINKSPTIQIINIAIDSKYIKQSEFWISEKIEINNFKEYSKSDSKLKNWSIEKSKLSLSFKNHNISLSSSNGTIFHTGTPFHMSIIDKNDPSSFKNLEELSISLALTLDLKNRSSSLVSLETANLTISKSDSNMIMEINDNPASSYLIKSLEKSCGYKQVKAFATITDQFNKQEKTYEIIAGGGEWGTKSNFLVLNGLTNALNGDSIKFSYLDDINDVNIEKNSFFIENVEISDDLNEFNEEDVSFDYFGIGSTDGFKLDDVNYPVDGEIVSGVIRD